MSETNRVNTVQLAIPSTDLQRRLQQLIINCIYGMAFFLPLSLNASTLFLSAGSLLWLAKLAIARRIHFAPNSVDIPILCFALWAGLSVTQSPDTGFSYYNYYHLMGRYIAIYYLTVHHIQTPEQLKRLVGCLLAAAALVTVYGFYQYVHGVDISAFRWVDGEQFPELKTRVFSTLYNPNLLAGYLVIIMALTAGVGLGQENRAVRYLLLVFVLLLGTCLVLTYSRGAWLSVLAVFAVYGALYNRRIFWLLLAVPLIVSAGYGGVMDRLASIVNPTDSSSALRWALWESTRFMILEKPLLGIGWGAYWLVYPEYDFFIQDAAKTIYHAHNTYLHLAAETGFPGLVAFLAVLIGHARLALRSYTQASHRWVKGLSLGLFAALLGLAVNGFTDHVLFNIELSMLFWLLLALVMAVHRLKGR